MNGGVYGRKRGGKKKEEGKKKSNRKAKADLKILLSSSVIRGDLCVLGTNGSLKSGIKIETGQVGA